VGLSVSRVGGKAQIKAMKQVAGTLRLDLAQYREMEVFAQFGTELDKAAIQQLERGKRLAELLKQSQYKPMPTAEQILVLYAGVKGFTDDVEVASLSRFEEELLGFMKKKHAKVLDEIDDRQVLSDALEAKLSELIAEFKGRFIVR